MKILEIKLGNLKLLVLFHLMKLMRKEIIPKVKLSRMELSALSLAGPMSSFAYRGPTKAPLEVLEDEGLEEEAIDKPEAQSSGDQDEIICVHRFMIMLSV